MSTEKLSPIQQELLSRADAIFDSLAKAVNTAGTFAMEQLPDIAYQFIVYNRVYHTIIFLVWLGTFSAGAWLMIWGSFKNFFKLTGIDAGFARTIMCIPACLIMGFGALGFLNHLKPLIMVWVAPKIFLIEQLITLVKR